MVMSYPRNTKFNNWSITHEKRRGKKINVIRRWVLFADGSKKLERYPTDKYRSIESNPEELKNLVVRLNNDIPIEQRTKKAIEIRHAYISPELLSDYLEFLIIQIPSKSRAKYEFSLLMRYCLNYFINTMNLNNPIQWHEIHKTKWANFLLTKGPNASDTKKNIVFAINRFIGWLHEKRPQEVPPLKFSPISKAKHKEIEAIREMNGEMKIRKFIPDKDWKTIEKHLKTKPEIMSTIILCYSYGLRRAEALGLKITDVRKGVLSIERQLESIPFKPVYSPPKGKKSRKVPHWVTKAANTYELISNIILMHPDTLTDKWNSLMHTIDMEYDIHDLRHTWITNMARIHNIRDVQMAAGHKNSQTTMGYLHDDRELNEELFIPETKIS